MLIANYLQFIKLSLLRRKYIIIIFGGNIELISSYSHCRDKKHY